MLIDFSRFRLGPAPVVTFAFVSAFSLSCSAQENDELPLPEETEQWKPVPAVVEAPANRPPSDAIVLFDGSDLSAWELQRADAQPWTVKDGSVTITPQKPGSGIKTKQSFGDIQLHLEFRSPAEVEGDGQGRGNSGIFFMDRYELQILDSYQNETYPNGQLGSIYKQYPPLVNPARAPGEWQSYDVVFIAPRFNSDGSLRSPARITAFLNGTLIQYDSELKGSTRWRGLPKYEAHPEKLPLSLQDHQDFVSFRNIWVRELDGEEIANRSILPELQ